MEDVKVKEEQTALLITQESTNAQVTNYLVENNTLEYNVLKGAEECSELSEVLIKFLTKNVNNTNRPTVNSMIEELGDVLFRGVIAVAAIYKLQNPECTNSHEKVLDMAISRAAEKTAKCKQNILNGKYLKGN